MTCSGANLLAAGLLAGLTVRGADLGPDLLLAARKGDPRRVAELLTKGASVSATDKKGRTPLMLAAVHGHEDVTRLLLEKGASAEARDREGWTAFGLTLFSSSDRRDQVLRLLPQPARLRVVLDANWAPDNLYSSCLMAGGKLIEHVAAQQPEMVAVAALRDLAAVSAMRLVELSEDGAGDARLSIKVRPGASCMAQQSADNLSLAIDAKLVRSRDEAVLLTKTFGGGLKGLHARTASSPMQYAKLYADWTTQHATAIYWAVLEAWLRAAP